jgi:hypothetical protein
VFDHAVCTENSNPDVMVNPPRASSLLFDLNGEASTARTKQISAIIAPT